VIGEMPSLNTNAKEISFVQMMRERKRQRTQGGPGVDLTNIGSVQAM